jgi:hypothetical protein
VCASSQRVKEVATWEALWVKRKHWQLRLARRSRRMPKQYAMNTLREGLKDSPQPVAQAQPVKKSDLDVDVDVDGRW